MTFYSRKARPALLASSFSIGILCVLVFFLPSGYGSYVLTQACVSPPPNLLSWYPGDGNANDIQGGRHGTLVGGATYAAGKVAQAFSFPSGASVNVPDDPAWTFGTQAFTIDLWANFNAIQGRDPFIGHDNGPGDVNKWIFWYDAQGHRPPFGPALRFLVGPSPNDAIVFPWQPNTGQWYHLAVTRAGNSYTLYIDGVPVITETNTAPVPDANAPLTIGRAEAFSLNGLIDEVEIFQRALSATEVQAIYNAGSAGKCKPQLPPMPCSKIAFDSTRDGNNQIYVMNADGMNQTRLTNNTANDARAFFSPDGSKIAFGSNRDGNYEIYVMNADGTNQTRLTNNQADDYIPNFSPDGSKIVFESKRDGGNEEIYIMNADGTGQTRLTNTSARDGNPAFSPDGSKIVFESYRDGNEEIYIMNVDGTNQTRLTNHPADDGDAFFSPDGSKIAFETNRDGGAWEIYVMNADGSGPMRLTNNTSNDTDPFFSPDGSKIAFETDRAGAGNYEVYVMNADGTRQTNLTNSPAHDFSPSWTGCKVNRPPSVRPTIITRVNGAPAKRSVIATVSDAETPAGALTVTVLGGSVGVSVTGLINDNGSVSADVAATCAATPGLRFVALQVTDGDGQTQTGALRVNVVEAALSYFSPALVSFNSARVVTPIMPPEGFASLSVDAPNFSGDLSVDQTTGVVSVSRARPAGSHTVTVTTINFCGVALTRSFTLIVANGKTEYQGAVGEPVPPSAPEQGSKGSLLLFNFYTSGAGGENTSITIANRHATLRATLHLFFVANDGSAADSFLCVPADSSQTFLVSNVDPGARGYLIAIAVDPTTGSPTSFNHLTGIEDIQLASGHGATDVRADTFQALFAEGTSLPVVAGMATINFDGVSYSRAARSLLLEDVPNPGGGNDTILIFNRIGGNLASRIAPLGGFRGILYEKSAPASFNPFLATATRAQFFSTLSDAFPLTMPSFSQLLAGGKDWRMVLHADSDFGLAGLALNRGPAKLNKNLLNSLTYTRVVSLTMPVFPVSGCP